MADDFGERMAAILVARRDELAGEQGIENAANFRAEMMQNPFRVEFGVVRDFDRFRRVQQFTKRREFGGSFQIAACPERF